MRLRDIFATKLRMARNAAGLSQEALADLAGTDRSYISELEAAKSAPTIDMIEGLSLALDVSPISLLTRD